MRHSVYISYPQAHTDNAALWQSEGFHFGEIGADDTNALFVSPDTGDVTTTAPAASVPWYQAALTTLTQTAQQVLPGAMNLYQQAQFNKANAERVARGIAPLSPQAYMSTQVPTASVAVGLDPNTRNMLIAGGVLAAAAFFMMRRRRG